jgi:hypothetical protein
MTAPRQRRKPSVGLSLALLIAVGGIITPPLARATIDEPIVVSASTGLAISGFDPVAYFIRHAPLFGKPDLELRLAGATWLFENPGNRDAFAEHPEVYMPRFGGYDPVAIARGASVPGNPLFWAIIGERLYLFYNGVARAHFVADPGRIIAIADRKWPAVAKMIGQ